VGLDVAFRRLKENGAGLRPRTERELLRRKLHQNFTIVVSSPPLR
jgi:hypothetical protein